MVDITHSVAINTNKIYGSGLNTSGSERKGIEFQYHNNKHKKQEKISLNNFKNNIL